MYRRRYELLDSLFAQMDSVVRHQVVTRGRGGLESLGGACSENTA